MAYNEEILYLTEFLSQNTAFLDTADNWILTYVGSFAIAKHEEKCFPSESDQEKTTEQENDSVSEQLKELLDKPGEKVLLLVSTAGIRMCTTDGETTIMAHALPRISFASCDQRQFAFVAREPKTPCNNEMYPAPDNRTPGRRYCHVYGTENLVQTENIRYVVQNAFEQRALTQQQLAHDRSQLQPLIFEYQSPREDDQSLIDYNQCSQSAISYSNHPNQSLIYPNQNQSISQSPQSINTKRAISPIPCLISNSCLTPKSHKTNISGSSSGRHSDFTDGSSSDSTGLDYYRYQVQQPISTEQRLLPKQALIRPVTSVANYTPAKQSLAESPKVPSERAPSLPPSLRRRRRQQQQHQQRCQTQLAQYPATSAVPQLPRPASATGTYGRILRRVFSSVKDKSSSSKPQSKEHNQMYRTAIYHDHIKMRPPKQEHSKSSRLRPMSEMISSMLHLNVHKQRTATGPDTNQTVTQRKQRHRSTSPGSRHKQSVQSNCSMPPTMLQNRFHTNQNGRNRSNKQTSEENDVFSVELSAAKMRRQPPPLTTLPPMHRNSPARPAPVAVDDEQNLMDLPWYCGQAPKTVVIRALELCPEEGAFLVHRQSTNQRPALVLSIRLHHPRPVVHYGVLTSRDGFQIEGGCKLFKTLQSLVTHHSILSEHLPCRLTFRNWQPDLWKRRWREEHVC